MMRFIVSLWNPSLNKGLSYRKKVSELYFVLLISSLLIFTWNLSSIKHFIFESKSIIIKDLNLKISLEDSCKPLLLDGTFEDEVEEQDTCIKTQVNYTNTNYNCMKTWKPYGCKMHLYSKREALKCLKKYSSENKHIFLLGDSRMRYIYNKMSLMLEDKILPKKFEDHAVFINKETNTSVMYIDRILIGPDFLDDISEVREISKTKPTITVIGITLHMIKEYSKSPSKGLELFKFYLQRAKKTLNEVGSRSSVLWYVQPPRSYELKAIITKTEEDLYHKNNTKHKSSLKNKNVYDAVAVYKRAKVRLKGLKLTYDLYKSVDHYNEAAINILSDTSVKIWHSAEVMGKISLEDYIDHCHLPDYVNYNYFQIIFNIFCNKRMNFQSNYCCS